jgi:GPH family glycoside/pentoside/hexuronide:cation symporter
VGEILIKIIGLDLQIGSFKPMCIIAPVVLGIGIGTFWTLFYSMGYDLVELNEFKTGQRRESTITALPQLVQKFGSAFGILMAGQLLSAYGYDSSNDVAGNESLFTQVTDLKIINGMENISTIIPAILIVISVISVIIYPMTRQRFEALMVQLEKKRKGDEYTTDGFEKLL